MTEGFIFYVVTNDDRGDKTNWPMAPNRFGIKLFQCRC